MAFKRCVLLFVLLLAGPVARAAAARDAYPQNTPVQLDLQGERWAQKTLQQLTLEQKIGQMLVIWSRAQFLNQESAQFQQLRETIRKYHIGTLGFTVPVDFGMVQKVMPFEAAALTNQLQNESDLPLLFAADFEYGLTMRVNGATPFPYPMAFGASGNLASAEAFGRIVAEEARAIGVQWNWFPTADVNSNPENPIINARSFGEDPKQVGDLISAYIRGAHQGGMLVTAKHFPGHGDTATDTHLGLARVEGNIARLESVELAPFRDAINAGVDSVMVAHVTVPALDPDTGHVASTSRAIVSGILKNKMGFQGLVVTDSLDMYGLMRLYSKAGNPSAAAAVAAVKAGNDMVLLPQDLDGAYRGLLNAVRNDEIPLSQIDQSVLRILRAKASLGLHLHRLVDPERLQQVIARPASIAAGEKAAQEGVTLVRDNNHLLPLRRGSASPAIARSAYRRRPAQEPSPEAAPARKGTLAVVFTDDVRSESGRVLIRELRARVSDATVFYVDPQLAGPLMDTVLQAVAQAEVVVAPVYVVPVSGKTVKIGSELKNTVSLTGDAAEMMKRILSAASDRTVVVALGNPYLAADFPGVQAYLCTFSSLPLSEVSAARALFGEAPIHGHLPVSIPGVAQRGTGIDRFAIGALSARKSRSHGKVVRSASARLGRRTTARP